MPIYEYRCARCGHELEAMQKLADEPLKDCPECNEVALKKLISPVGFRLKGSGWYETDFKSGDKKKNLVETSDNKPENKPENKPDNKPENKPAEAKAEKSTDSKPKSDNKTSTAANAAA